jgi:hypothetical protein
MSMGCCPCGRASGGGVSVAATEVGLVLWEHCNLSNTMALNISHWSLVEGQLLLC